MRALRLWPLVVVLLLGAVFGTLELRAPSQVKATFTLVGLVSCNSPSGTVCPIGQTLTLLSDDSGTKQLYTIDLRWVQGALPEDLEQDQEIRIEIERLPDGTLMALRVILLDDRNGVLRDDEGPTPSSSEDNRRRDREEDDPFVAQGQATESTTTTTQTAFVTACVPATSSVVASTTRTGTLTATSTFVTTSTSTAVTTVVVIPITVTVTVTTTVPPSGLAVGPAALTTATVFSTSTSFPCGTTTSTSTTTGTTSTTVTTPTTSTTARRRRRTWSSPTLCRPVERSSLARRGTAYQTMPPVQPAP
jgi:hypothetical protein